MSLTLEQSESLALERSDRLAAASQRWEAERARIGAVGVLPDPSLSFETRVRGDQDTLMLKQMVPWPGRLAAQKREQAERAEASLQQVSFTREELVRQVRSLWYELTYLEQAQERVRASAELLQGVEEALRSQYRTSSGTLSRVLAVQLERDRVLDRVESLDIRRRVALARLNELLGREADAPLVRVGDGTPGPLADPDILRQDVLTRNPRLLASRREAAAGEEGLAVARTVNKPDFMLGASWMVNEPSMGMGSSDADPFMVEFGLTLPIWPGKNRAVVDQAAARRLSLEFQAADMRRQVLVELDTLLLNHRDAGRRVILYRETLIPQAEQAFASLRRSFAASEVTFADLIDSQRRLLDLQLQAEEAVLAKHQIQAAIEAMRGTNFPNQPENQP
ncbi:MAG: TolC family protein [Lentisphaeria bacterium]|nr:TolC family protein [Lentisphaeria bacterium]